MSFCSLRRFAAVLVQILTELMAGRVEIEPLIAVSLIVWRAGAPIMEAHGRSRSKGDSSASLRSGRNGNVCCRELRKLTYKTQCSARPLVVARRSTHLCLELGFELL